MKLPLLKLLRSFRASYWFVPSLMVVAAIALGAFMIWLDAGPASRLLEPIGWYQQSKPEGAREVLSAIAGSMITVAGVVFSITIVAISFAANQYGPRILTNFMSDRGNQITLGTFIATFVYCLVVLRTIYSGDSEFVPQLAVMVAMALALCSIVVLIYFIHHVPQSIHINTITAHVGRQLISLVSVQFPDRLSDPPEHSDEEEAILAEASEAAFAKGRSVAIDCEQNGYLQALDEEQLLSVACRHDLLVRLVGRPGAFLYCGQTVALAAPAERLTEELSRSIRRCWSMGSKRTPEQDLLFLIDELVEIAARALSTGVNDPYTAMTCIDWLTAAAAEIARRRAPSPFRLDDKGILRVVAPTGSFKEHLERGFGRLRPYAARDINAAAHFMTQLAELTGQCRSAEQVKAVLREAEALIDLARREHSGASLERLEREGATARAMLEERLASFMHEPPGPKAKAPLR